MKEDSHIDQPGRQKGRNVPALGAEPQDEPSPEAAAAAANQLPPTEQLSEFEKTMEHDDGGNQPS